MSYVRPLATRALRGPEPPIGVPFMPRATWRCRLGIHQWADVWEATVVAHDEDYEHTDEGLVRHVDQRLGFNLDREADYTRCCWCVRMRHLIAVPMADPSEEAP